MALDESSRSVLCARSLEVRRASTDTWHKAYARDRNFKTVAVSRRAAISVNETTPWCTGLQRKPSRQPVQMRGTDDRSDTLVSGGILIFVTHVGHVIQHFPEFVSMASVFMMAGSPFCDLRPNPWAEQRDHPDECE
tara:strand:- start:51 stop:458 length:408 start_codon:yes stop_codon:yes gene_type:complete